MTFGHVSDVLDVILDYPTYFQMSTSIGFRDQGPRGL